MAGSLDDKSCHSDRQTPGLKISVDRPNAESAFVLRRSCSSRRATRRLPTALEAQRFPRKNTNIWKRLDVGSRARIHWGLEGC